MSQIVKDILLASYFIFILINPLAATVRVLRFASRPADYIRPKARWGKILSGTHDVLAMVIAPLFYFTTVGVEVGQFTNSLQLISIGGFSILAIVAYFIGLIRKELLPPAFEATLTLLLGVGIAINGYLLWEAEVRNIGYVLGAIGHLPVIALCTMMVYRRHRRFQLATIQEKILSEQHTDVLDYFPDRSVPEPYVVSRDGWERFFWLEGWQKLMMSIIIGGGVLLLLVSLENWLM